MDSVIVELSMRSFPWARSVEWWSLVNAGGMISAAVISGVIGTVWPLILGGTGLLCGLVLVMWGQWTPEGDFGGANAITAVRIGLFVFMPSAAAAGASILISLCLGILVTDAVDGWLARKTGRSSTFGSFFDKESDALFLLVLCGLAAFHGRLPLWILGAGLLRYLFVVLLFFIPGSKKTEERSSLARYIYGGMIAALLFSFLPYPSLYQPVVIGATSLLAGSFGHSLWTVIRRRKAFPS